MTGAPLVWYSLIKYLEIQLQTELQRARVMRAGQFPERRWSIDVHAQSREVHVIEGIEEFAAELQAGALCNLEIPNSRHIPVFDTRREENAAAGIAEMPDGICKCRHIEPIVARIIAR